MGLGCRVRGGNLGRGCKGRSGCPVVNFTMTLIHLYPQALSCNKLYVNMHSLVKEMPWFPNLFTSAVWSLNHLL